MASSIAFRRKLLLGSAATLALSFAASAVAARQVAPAPPSDATPLSGVAVVGQPPADYKVDLPANTKLTQPILDTPTIIAEIPRPVIEDRGARSLSDVFKNASGITIGAGESSWQGTNLIIRGFNARNDMYLDGMRDFGSYYRDPFDLEDLEVLQGPSSMLFGRGSTGGTVNQVSKTPTLVAHLRGEVTFGTDDTHRLTADIDEPIPQLGEGAAFRLNVMAHEQGVEGRPEAEFHRYGVAPSLALGLGTPTRLTLSYFHQQEHDLPDYGVPWLLGKPAPVARDSFYGFTSDFLDTTADVTTAKLEHDFSPALTVRTQLRYANYSRTWRDTEPQPVTTGVTAATPLSSILVNRALQGGSSREYLLQDQTDLLAHFDTGPLHHTLAAGFEIGPEGSNPEYDNGLNQPQTTLLNPTLVPFSGTQFPRIRVTTDAFSIAGYVVDTVKIGSHWELTGGVRYDHLESDYEAQTYSTAPATLGQPTTAVTDKRTDEAPSYRAGIVYKPTADSSLYFDYSTSFNPSAEALSQIVAVRSLNQGNLFLAPEKNRVFEVGGKWDTLSHHLLLQGAIFREEKTNARIPDPTNSALNILGGNFRVDGFEIEAAGRLTSRWQITASYTYLDGTVIKSAPGGPRIGQGLFDAPNNALAIWTTYQITDRLQVGGGMNYVDERIGQNTNPVEIAPAYATGDLMAKYQLTPALRLQFNLINVADAYYFEQVHGFHLIPGEGRTALFSLGVSF